MLTRLSLAQRIRDAVNKDATLPWRVSNVWAPDGSGGKIRCYVQGFQPQQQSHEVEVQERRDGSKGFEWWRTISTTPQPMNCGFLSVDHVEIRDGFVPFWGRQMWTINPDKDLLAVVNGHHRMARDEDGNRTEVHPDDGRKLMQFVGALYDVFKREVFWDRLGVMTAAMDPMLRRVTCGNQGHEAYGLASACEQFPLDHDRLLIFADIMEELGLESFATTVRKGHDDVMHVWELA